MIEFILRYDMVQTLGTGTVAKSYTALERVGHGLTRPVTLKQLEGEDVSPDRLATLRELSLVHHSGLRLPRGLVVNSGGVAVICDYLVGRSLVGLVAQCIRQRRPLSEQAATHLFARAAESIADLHEGWLGSPRAHGAIRPSNLLFSDLGELWIDDAGLAADPCELARRGTLSLEHARYASPEALATAAGGAESLNRKEAHGNDVYGLAACLYTLATLRRPFDEMDLNTLLTRKTEAPVSARRINPRVSRELAALLMSVLSPSGPRQKARGLARALRALAPPNPPPSVELRALIDSESLVQHQQLLKRCHSDPAVELHTEDVPTDMNVRDSMERLPDEDEELATDIESPQGLSTDDSLETDPMGTVVAAAEDIFDISEHSGLEHSSPDPTRTRTRTRTK
ncbi:MAG: hypothetical protein JRH20_10980 [Deltaproteobacteria bacterium]|nr:hypothetical protein [Deltaproteobacteria bacterium]